MAPQTRSRRRIWPAKRRTRRKVSRRIVPRTQNRTMARSSMYVTRNYVTSTSKHRGYAHIKKKTFFAPVATVTELGATPTVGRVTNSSLKATPTGDGSTARQFILEDFPDYATYQGIYQFYKILYVKLIIYPQQNSYSAFDNTPAFNSSATALTAFAPEVTVATDKMTTTIFGTQTEAFNHEGAKYHLFNDSSEFCVYVEPTVVQSEGPTGSEVNVPGQPMWIPTSSAAIPHNGLRLYWNNFNEFTSFRLMYEMKVAFKGLKT